MADFSVRGLELHSSYAWDYDCVMKVMNFLQTHNMNTLVLHRNDFIDLIIYPGKYFGNEDRTYNSIFERYSEIYEKLYQYTPTRRSGPYQRRAYLKRILEQARRRGIDVYIENKELFFPDIILEFFPHLVKNGKICANDPFWLEFLNIKYTEFFEEFPEISGIITAPATGESRISIKSNRCTCDLCKTASKEIWFKNVLNAMYTPLHKAGKKLIIRDFVFDPNSQKEICSVMEDMPEDVIISLKNTPHDYFPTFPINTRIGHVGNHQQWIEFDTMGQYFGWGVSMADLTEDYRKRLKHAKENGASGAIFRLDWESLDAAIPFKTHNLINLYAGAALTNNIDASCNEIYETFLQDNSWFKKNITMTEKNDAISWFSNISSKTWEITRHTLYVDDCVFSDSSVIPISYNHAFWLAEVKNSLRDWDNTKWNNLAPTAFNVDKIIKEKEYAMALIENLKNLVKTPCIGILAEKKELLSERINVNSEYVQLFSKITKALILSRYVIETQENKSTQVYLKYLNDCKTAVLELEHLSKHLFDINKTTDYYPHVVYTLLDGDRVVCLYNDLKDKLLQLI